MSVESLKGTDRGDIHLSPLEFLRKHTASLHAQLESTVDLKTSLSSISSYRSLLSGHLSIYKPFEAALFSSASNCFGRWSYQSKLTLLEQDLVVLGAPAAGSEPWLGPRLPKLADPDSILGALYVVEGSSLGGQVIYREIRRRLRLDASSGAAFFFGAGPATGSAWKEFLAILEAQITQPQRAASAACAMFEAFRHGLQLNRETTQP